jgi:hypothetical protein
MDNGATRLNRHPLRATLLAACYVALFCVLPAIHHATVAVDHDAYHCQICQSLQRSGDFVLDDSARIAIPAPQSDESVLLAAAPPSCRFAAAPQQPRAPPAA